MVGHHVAKCARRVVVAAALFHADILSHSNLHVVDIAAVPDRFKDSVRESKHQNVLNRLLSQIVIDAIDLMLLQAGAQTPIQSSGRIEAGTKGLLDDHAPPAAVLLLRQPGSAQLLNNG